MTLLLALPIFYDIFNFCIYKILPFLFILGFCVIIHEFGHFIFAKLFRIPVEKFSIGFGPPFFRRKIGETDFRIAYFPLGGYVKMAGEDEGEIIKNGADISPQEYLGPGFYEVPIYKRIIVVSGGPLFNVLSAAAVIVFTFSIFGLSVNPYTKIEVEENSQAYQAGFLSGDSIIAVDNKKINNWDEFLTFVSSNQHKEITITVKRDDMEISRVLKVTPDSLGFASLIPPILGIVKRAGPAYTAGMRKGDRVLMIDNKEIRTWTAMVDMVRKNRDKPLLFQWQHDGQIKTALIKPTKIYDPLAADSIGLISVFMPLEREYLSPLKTLSISVDRTWSMIWLTLKIFYQLVTRKISTKALGGPIAIAKLSGESAQWGFEYLLGLLAIIAINLGIINLFPIPALDGGHIMVSIIEVLRGKRLSRNTRMKIQQVGYAIIFLLIIFVTFNDITR